MQNQTRLDRFTQAHFIGEHHTRGVSAGNLLRDVKLVWNQIDASANKSANGRFTRTMEHFQSAATQLKRPEVIEASGKQTFLRSLQTDEVAQLRFRQFLI